MRRIDGSPFARPALVEEEVYRLAPQFVVGEGDRRQPAYARYQHLGEPFVEDYLAMVGIDLSDPDVWNSGLDLIDARLSEAETLAEAHAG